MRRLRAMARVLENSSRSCKAAADQTKMADEPSMINRRYLRPWIARGLVARPSAIHSLGVFPLVEISEGVTVIRLGGYMLSVDEVRAGQARVDSVTGYSEGIYLGEPHLAKGESTPIDEFLNHSCDPNLWLVGPVRLVARRRIAAGEELTVDYSTWEIDNEWVLPAPCKCGSQACRGRITGRDWTIPEFQAKYAGHLLPCIADRIQRFERKAA